MGKRKNRIVIYLRIFIMIVFMFLISCNKKKSDDNNNIIIKDNPSAYTKWDEIFTDHKIIKFKGLSEENELVDIRDLGINSKGEYFIQDSKKKSILYFDVDGNLKKTIGGYGEGPGEAIMPALLRFDDNDNLYVYDFLKKKIIKFSFPSYNYETEFKIKETFYDYFITINKEIIATTPYSTDNFVIHKYDKNGKVIGSAFLPEDLKFAKFITTFGLYRISKTRKKGFLYIFPDKYKIYQYDYNLRLIRTYTAEKETEYFPFKGHFPYGETPYEFTKKNQRWWESKFVPWRVKRLNEKCFFIELAKFKRHNIEDSFINIHTFDGKTIAKGVRIPFKGIIRYVKDGYIYVVETDRVDEKTGDLIPQVIHRYRFRL